MVPATSGRTSTVACPALERIDGMLVVIRTERVRIARSFLKCGHLSKWENTVNRIRMLGCLTLCLVFTGCGFLFVPRTLTVDLSQFTRFTLVQSGALGGGR